jgi:lipoate-protein ligase A
MAVDELLLENADRGEFNLRFYSWQPATLSLGYFQPAEARRSHSASLECPLVRRPSGGSALIHGDDDHELTYCVTLPDVGRSRSLPRDLLDLLHRTLVVALGRFGVRAQLAETDQCVGPDDAFLCFQKHTAGDVLINQSKVAGSAQRRLARALMQHGSVLLSQLNEAPELPGIAQLTGRRLSRFELQAAWLGELSMVWPLDWRAAELSSEEQRRAARKCHEKYMVESWTLRR